MKKTLISLILLLCMVLMCGCGFHPTMAVASQATNGLITIIEKVNENNSPSIENNQTVCALEYVDSVYTISVLPVGSVEILYFFGEEELPEMFVAEINSLRNIKSIIKLDNGTDCRYYAAIHDDGTVSVMDLNRQVGEAPSYFESEMEKWTNIKSISFCSGQYTDTLFCGVTTDGKVKVISNDSLFTHYTEKQTSISSWKNIDHVIIGCNTIIGIRDDGKALGAGYLFTEDYAGMYSEDNELLDVSRWDNAVDGYIADYGPGPEWLTVHSDGKLSGSGIIWRYSSIKDGTTFSNVYSKWAFINACLSTDGVLYLYDDGAMYIRENIKQFMFVDSELGNLAFALDYDGNIELFEFYYSSGYCLYNTSSYISEIVDVCAGMVVVLPGSSTPSAIWIGQN